MIIMPINSWSDYKSTVVTSKGLLLQYTETSDRYDIYASEKGQFVWTISLLKDDGADVTDFEDNFKTDANQPLLIKDSDGAEMTRLKMFKSGVAVRFHFFSFKTSDLDSLKHRKADGSTSFGYCTYKLYDSNGNEITDAQYEANAVKTVIDWEPPSIDYEIVGGKFYQAAAPGSDVYVHVVGVPDVPEAYGGSISFASDANLKLMGPGLAFETDGRVPKAMRYDGTNHTSKLRIIFYHSAGVQHECMGELEIAH